MTREAFVTGARGCIGRAVCRRLETAGFAVRGVDLDPDREARIVAGDISVGGAWQRAVEGCEVVVHTAAVVSNVASATRAWEVNVLGTRNVVDAAIAGGATRFVHLSSVAVYGHERPDPVTEQHPVRPTGSPYGDTKIAAEQVVLQAHASGSIDACVLRPGDVYGPGSRPWTILPIEMLRRHQVVLPAGGHGDFSAVYVDDVAEVVARAATRATARGQVFNVAGHAPVETGEFFSYYARMLGHRRVPSAPTAAAIVVAETLGRLARGLGSRSEASAATMRMLAARGAVSIEKAGALLGFEPQIDLAEGMQRTETWLREAGYLDGTPAGAVPC